MSHFYNASARWCHSSVQKLSLMAPWYLQIKFKLLPFSKFGPLTIFPSSSLTFFQARPPTHTVQPNKNAQCPHKTPNSVSDSRFLLPGWNTFPQNPLPLQKRKSLNSLSLLWISTAIYPFFFFSDYTCLLQNMVIYICLFSDAKHIYLCVCVYSLKKYPWETQDQ